MFLKLDRELTIAVILVVLFMPVALIGRAFSVNPKHPKAAT